jgi:hypothetical protein
MKGIALRRAIGVLVILAFAAGAYAQGLYWESKGSGAAGERSSRHYYMPKMFKSMEDENGSVIIFRLDKEILYKIHPKEKTYQQMTFAEMEAAMKKGGEKMDKKMAELQKQMESMPPERRKMMEDQMGAFMPGKEKDQKIEVIAMGDRATISGFPASKYIIKRNGKEMLALWTTKELKGYDAMRDDFDQFIKRSMRMSPIAKAMADAFTKVEGFPVQTEVGKMKETVTKIERRAIPASEFDVPAGYTLEKGSPLGDTGEEN